MMALSPSNVLVADAPLEFVTVNELVDGIPSCNARSPSFVMTGGSWAIVAP
jgi:hypothetical protein